jgi:membrane protein implicated in regulation of membrane protease activity
MPGWVLWAVLAVALGIGELLTPGLFWLGPLALAAVVAAAVAALGAGAVIATVIFLAGAIASLGLLRPLARAHIRMPAISRTGTDALVGRKGLVLRRVDAADGLVRIGGEEWTARPYLDGQVLEQGAQVEIVKIEGATALVIE